MKHHFREHRAVRKGNLRTLGRQELDSNILKSALVHWHLLHVPILVLTQRVGVGTKRPYATD